MQTAKTKHAYKSYWSAQKLILNSGAYAIDFLAPNFHLQNLTKTLKHHSDTDNNDDDSSDDDDDNEINSKMTPHDHDFSF